MREDHRVHQPDPAREPRRADVGERVHRARPEEERAHDPLVDVKAAVEEEREHRRRQEPAPEAVQREEGRYPRDDPARLGRDAGLLFRRHRLHARGEAGVEDRGREEQERVEADREPERVGLGHRGDTPEEQRKPCEQ